MNNIVTFTKEKYWRMLSWIYTLNWKAVADMRYWPYRVWYRTECIRHAPMHYYWQLTKGFCYCEAWSLYSNIAEYTIPRLKYLRETVNSAPTSMFDLPTFVEISTKAYELYLKRIENNQDGNSAKDWEDAELFFLNNMGVTKSNIAHKKWKATLDEMIWAFEYSIGNYDKYPNVILGLERIDNPNDFDKLLYKSGYQPIYDWNLIKQNEERCQRGLELFSKHFQELWD